MSEDRKANQLKTCCSGLEETRKKRLLPMKRTTGKTSSPPANGHFLGHVEVSFAKVKKNMLSYCWGQIFLMLFGSSFGLQKEIPFWETLPLAKSSKHWNATTSTFSLQDLRDLCVRKSEVISQIDIQIASETCVEIRNDALTFRIKSDNRLFTKRRYLEEGNPCKMGRLLYGRQFVTSISMSDLIPLKSGLYHGALPFLNATQSHQKKDLDCARPSVWLECLSYPPSLRINSEGSEWRRSCTMHSQEFSQHGLQLV